MATSFPERLADAAGEYILNISPEDTAKDIYGYACGWTLDGWRNAVRQSAGILLTDFEGLECINALDILHERAFGRPVGHNSPLITGDDPLMSSL